MRRELIEQLKEKHPALLRGPPTATITPHSGETRLHAIAPHPDYLLEIMPDALGQKLLELDVKIKHKEEEDPDRVTQLMGSAAIAQTRNKPSRAPSSAQTIEIPRTGFQKFPHAVGLFIWHHALTPGHRNWYTNLVGAANEHKLWEKPKRWAKHSTAEHFARNVQNLVMLRPLEAISHEEGVADALLDFFQDAGMTNKEHRRLYVANGGKRIIIASDPKAVEKQIEENSIYHPEAEEIRRFIRAKKR